MGGEGGRDGTPVPVLVPAKIENQVQYTGWSHTLRVFLLHELEYKAEQKRIDQEQKTREAAETEARVDNADSGTNLPVTDLLPLLQS